ncbi:uncharacterized protein PHACADRAFT_136514 [Phanerochaete carnosa HHB-10118-sp]|uniref:WW domain-containing protein n=1 Tax=Phanerochaete carnosa (strain HHB-10118-sp) TaxID=650164 RepID=K5V8M4_PHACS|nr:uncharacterized protein PHACADRAFT_136514 [Phanerochaete carnosa HHB-10118-sp]EKM59176.1 hypothetical protein PHACADRAFT_136514 [Phanerochaete carnosa HHB-10118-sp]
MQSLPFVPPAAIPPPLPPGWSEHTSPTGQLYYYNVVTKESTYTRPLPAFPIPKKKEKPLVKTPIPGTDWLRVKTTEGNVFYSHKTERRSLWTVPDEIKEAVEELERREAEERRRGRDEEEAKRKAEEEERKEAERVKAEVKAGKRKAEVVPVEEVVISKKAKMEEDEAGAKDEDDDDEDEDEDESDMEDWQREAAEQLAKEAEEEQKRLEEVKKREEEEEKERMKAEAETQKNKPLNMPDKVDLSIDEAKALFKTLLREKDINPLHPWDSALPLFVNDPRYVLLPSVSVRKEAFDEYCRDRARELRQSKVKQEKAAANPKEEFEQLLKDEVKSTRTNWTEWRRQWKKDRRFYSWGKDDREREKRFREYLKELGEKKRAAAQKAESDFFALLKESGIFMLGAVWKDVKKKIVDDPRYDAVGSSSLREELFSTFMKAQGVAATPTPEPGQVQVDGNDQDDHVEGETEKERKREERKERAVREREEKIKAERSKLDIEIDRSRSGLNKEESELEFKTLLVDAIRDPQVRWDDVLLQLERDPRFTRSVLPLNQRLHLFHTHVTQLRTKHLGNLHALFASHSPSLNARFAELPVSSLVTSLPATKLGYDVHALEDEYERWNRERVQEARHGFDQMLAENSFVEFWGRLGKIGGQGVDKSIKADDIGEDDEEVVDMKALAKTVDLKEMVKVLKNDKRYLVLDHIPEQREQWLRDYLVNLSAPKLSVHIPESS